MSRPSSPLLRESSRMTSLTWRHTLRVESVPRQFVVRPRLKCAIVVSLYLLFEACLYSVLCALYSPCSLQSCTSISSSLVPRSQTKICKNVQILLLSVPAGPGYTSVKIFLMMIVTPLCKFCPNCFMPNFCNIFLVDFSIFCEEDCPAAYR